jgi:hypothetical protein
VYNIHAWELGNKSESRDGTSPGTTRLELPGFRVGVTRPDGDHRHSQDSKKHRKTSKQQINSERILKLLLEIRYQPLSSNPDPDTDTDTGSRHPHAFVLDHAPIPVTASDRLLPCIPTITRSGRHRCLSRSPSPPTFPRHLEIRWQARNWHRALIPSPQSLALLDLLPHQHHP